MSISASQTILEGNSGTTAFAYTLTLNRGGSTAAYPYSWTVAGSGANPADANDFGGTFPSGSGTFATGETSKTITILASGDTTVETDETFTLTVATTGLNTVTSTGAIGNDDTAPAQTVTLATPIYADNFSTPTTATALAGRSGWTAQDGSYANFVAGGGGLKNTTDYGPGQSAFLGDAVGNSVVEFYYTTTGGWDTQRVLYYAWYIDKNNHVQISHSSGRLYVRVFVGGTNVVENFWNKSTLLPTNTVRVTFVDGTFRAMLNGQWLNEANNVYTYPADKLDFSAKLPSGNQTGRIGLFQGLGKWNVVNSLKIENADFVINFADVFVGRDSLAATGGTTLIRGTIAAGRTPTAWTYRLLTPGTLAEVSTWQEMKNVTVTGQTMTGEAFLPTGGPYIVQAGYVDADGKTRAAYSQNILSGIRGEYWGQSNAANRAATGIATKTAQAATNLSSSQMQGATLNAWATAYDNYNANTTYPAANIISAALAKPVGIGVQGVGGVPIETLIPGGAGWSLLTSALAARRGVVEFVVWDQGEGNADGASNPTDYSATFRTKLLPGLRDVCKNPDLVVFISPVGRFASTGSAPYPDLAAGVNDKQRATLRAQYLDIVSKESKVFIADHKLGTLHSDSYHYNNGLQGYSEMSRREGYTIAKYFGANVADGLGAKITGAVRSGATITMSVDLNGGNGLTDLVTTATGNVPAPYQQGKYGYQVSSDDFVTTLAISDVVRSGNTLVITLAADPGAAVKVRSFHGWSFDDTNLFYTTYADGRANIPVAPIMVALSASTSTSSTINNTPSNSTAQTMSVDGADALFSARQANLNQRNA